MATKVIKTTFLLRRGTSEAWNRVNPILKYGEPGFEKDTNKLKIGDGEKDWKTLPYFGGNFDISADGKSIIITSNGVELNGYAAAQEGQIPHKSAEGLDWKDAPSAITNEELQQIFEETKGE